MAVVGVGDCCSAFIQGVWHYRKKKKAVGLRHPKLGKYTVSDIVPVAAFDVDERKVGKDLCEAIFSEPNAAAIFCQAPRTGVDVMRGPVLDGVPDFMRDVVRVDASSKSVEVDEVLKESDAEIVLDLLPVGSIRATRWYAEQAIKAGCAFINATSSSVASDANWAKKFTRARLAVVGDDLMDQIGATVLHRALLSLLNERGVHVDNTYQLDVGGGTESLITLGRARDVKRKIKSACVGSDLPYRTPLVAGTTDYVPFLRNQRDNFVWIEGTYFGNSKILVDIRFSASDAENAGSILMDVVRGTKIAIDRGVSGPLPSVSAYGFKRPPMRVPLAVASQWFSDFVKGKRKK